MVDIELIINKLESEHLIKTNKVTGNYMQIYCPFHSDGNEKKPSCGISLQDVYKNNKLYPAGFFHCFACSYAKPLIPAVSDLLKKHSVSESAVDWLKENIPGFSTPNDIEYDTLIPNDTLKCLDETFALDYILNLTAKQQDFISEDELQKYRFTVPYMYERKLTDELIEKFDIGYDAEFIPPGRKNKVPCITFPVRDIEGHTLFMCRRSIRGKLFNYPTGVTKPVYGIYELPKGCKSVIICESCFNALTAWRYGKPAVALLGTGNPYQIQQLKQLGVNEFVLALDPDEAGNKGREKLKRALKSVAMVYEYINIPIGKDLNDLTEDEFNSLEIE